MQVLKGHQTRIAAASVAHARRHALSWTRSVLDVLTAILRQPGSVDCLSSHIRRDAGVDELELERDRVVRAPLIRW